MKKFLLIGIIFAFASISCENHFETAWTRLYSSGELRYEGVRSGLSASLPYTKVIRAKLPEIIKKYKVQSILDIGCGDFSWISQVITDEIQYTGWDIVQSVIDDNKAQFEKSNIHFKRCDALIEPMPKADLVICRDFLPHLSYSSAEKFFIALKESGSTYVLLTSYNKFLKNENIVDSEGISNYQINLFAEPFMFPEPLEWISEEYPLNMHIDKHFALWKAKSLIFARLGAVTYLDEQKWGGRLGDKLLMYVKAKWVAFKYGMRFFYKPFKYSDQLMMHVLDKHWEEGDEGNYTEMEDPYFQTPEQSRQNWLQGTEIRKKLVDLKSYIQPYSFKLHIISYYFNPQEWGNFQARYDAQDISTWKGLFDSKEFLHVIRQTIAPNFDWHPIQLPKNKITVAVHVRKGGGFDGDLLSLQLLHADVPQLGKKPCFCSAEKDDFVDKAYGIKFPPDQFYVDNIKKLSEYFDNKPLYVHVFTDDLDPDLLVQRYKKAIGKKNITWGCRSAGNYHDSNVLQDLFDMTQFDCLIRSGSNFPQVAQLLADYKVVIYPRNAEWGNMLNIYDVGYLFEKRD